MARLQRRLFNAENTEEQIAENAEIAACIRDYEFQIIQFWQGIRAFRDLFFPRFPRSILSRAIYWTITQASR